MIIFQSVFASSLIHLTIYVREWSRVRTLFHTLTVGGTVA